MKALKGVIIDTQDQILVVRAESGLEIKIQRQQGLGYGDMVDVLYDYTRNRVVGISPHRPDGDITPNQEIEPDVEEVELCEDETLVPLGIDCTTGEIWWG
jgi:hypothetical protein